MYDRSPISGNDGNASGHQRRPFGLRGLSVRFHFLLCLVAFAFLIDLAEGQDLVYEFQSVHATPTCRVGRDVIFKGTGTIFYRVPPATGWSSKALTAAGVTIDDFSYWPSGGYWAFGLSVSKTFNTQQTGVPDKQQSPTAERFYEYTRDTAAGVLGTSKVQLPAVSLTHTRITGNGTSEFHFEVEPVVIDFGDGSKPPEVKDPTIPPPVENPLLGLAGQELTVPLYREGGGPVVLEIGGNTYTGDPDPNTGVANVTFVIPPNWDGTAKVNGEVVALAPKMAYTGTPGMSSLYANPYTDTLPPGMTKYTPSTPITYPPGVTAGSSLSLPSGVTVATSAQMGEYLLLQVTKAGVTTNYVVNTNNPDAKPTTQTGGTSGGSSGGTSSNPKAGTTTGGATSPSGTPDSGGEIAGYSGGFGDGTGKEAPSKGIVDRAVQAREDLRQLLTGLSPIAPNGGLPRVSTYTISWDFGKFGRVDRIINFGEPPWTILRTAMLVVVIMVTGNAFFKRVTI